MLKPNLPYGTYHVANEGYCSWFDFAKAIFDMTGLKPTLTPTRADQFPTKAQRPIFSAMKTNKLAQYGMKPRPWSEALRDYLVEKGYLAQQQGPIPLTHLEPPRCAGSNSSALLVLRSHFTPIDNDRLIIVSTGS
jgi:hypothetical protein